MIPQGNGGGVESKKLDSVEEDVSVLWAQVSFDEALFNVVLRDIDVSDLLLEHVYNGFLGGIADGACVGGGVLKMDLLVHDRKHAM